MVDTADSKSAEGNLMPVRVRPPLPAKQLTAPYLNEIAVLFITLSAFFLKSAPVFSEYPSGPTHFAKIHISIPGAKKQFSPHKPTGICTGNRQTQS